MTRKKGDDSIQPEQRLKWLKRFGEGESKFKIATDAEVDYRTVTRHIELARVEKELKDERGIVMRGALERHFSDLLSIVDIMLNCLDTGDIIEFLGDDEFIQKALREHIPRSAIWALVGNWNSHVTGITQLEARISEKLEKTIESDVTLISLNKQTGEMFRRIKSVFKSWEKNHITTRHNLNLTKTEEIANVMSVVSSILTSFGLEDKKDLIIIQTALSKIQREMEAWEEFTQLGNQYHKLTDIQTKLKEALRILKWKRVVPGRCRLCPM